MYELPCKHSFCAYCCQTLIKVTKLHKAIAWSDQDKQNLIDAENGGIQSAQTEIDLTCPQEGQKHKVNDYHIDLFAELIEVESLREKLRKRNESKLLQLY